MKKDLVQELRKLACSVPVKKGLGLACDTLLPLFDTDETNCLKRDCDGCAAAQLNALADRIEAEYEPLPEPDTLESVAVEMWKYLEHLYGSDWVPTKVPVQTFSERLEALGVTFDD